MPRDFTPKPAVRSKQPLLLGVSGPPGAGKTKSSLILATGIKADRGGDIIFLDNDGDRGLQYAPLAGQKPDFVHTFDFHHVTFDPPYNSSEFKDAILQNVARNPACIIVDVMSAEHEGEGGLLEYHEAELSRMAGDDWAKRDRMTQAAWIKPKRARLEMINTIMKIKTPIIFNFKAREKTKQLKNAQGKLVPTNIGWTPIAPAEIIGSMTLFCLLPNHADGVPMWKGNTTYEDFSIKLPGQFRDFIRDGEPLSQEMGRAMSEWARGVNRGDGDHQTEKPTAQSIDLPTLQSAGNFAAKRGGEVLKEWWGTLSNDQRSAMKPFMPDIKARAQEFDDKSAGEPV
jgi:hypothetical protein